MRAALLVVLLAEALASRGETRPERARPRRPDARVPPPRRARRARDSVTGRRPRG